MNLLSAGLTNLIWYSKQCLTAGRSRARQQNAALLKCLPNGSKSVRSAVLLLRQRIFWHILAVER